MRERAAKTLLLLRHAKSNWDDRSLTDHDRPLAPRGRKAAKRMGRYLAENDLVPDLVLTSSSSRTLETVKRLQAQIDRRLEVVVERDLYLTSAGAVLDRVRSVRADVGTLLVVGHSPTTEDLALALTGSGPPASIDQIRDKYPTGSLVELRFEVGDWSELSIGGGELVRFVRPRELD